MLVYVQLSIYASTFLITDLFHATAQVENDENEFAVEIWFYPPRYPMQSGIKLDWNVVFLKSELQADQLVLIPRVYILYKYIRSKLKTRAPEVEKSLT